MACAHPLHFAPQTKAFGKIRSYPRAIDIPCGYCVNCRRDYQNYICDRAQYEYCKRLTASFVTLTYDDPHLIRECAVTDQFGMVFDDGSPRCTLVYKHIRNFIHALRQDCLDNPETCNVLKQSDFSYLYCGEYGDMYGRCHFHVLFFGLDFAYCEKLFRKKWKYGIIDVLPLLDGGIRYVTKYMDKMLKGDLAFYEYDVKGLARPALRMSQGFGQGLLWDNVDDIINNYYTYRVPHNKRRPISAYWKYLLTGNTVLHDVTKESVFKEHPAYTAFKRIKVAQRMRDYHLQGRVNIYSPYEQRKFKLRQALAREYELKRQIRNEGHPVYDDITSCMSKRFGWITYDGKKIRKLPTASKRLLAEEYTNFLIKEWLYDKFPL